MVAAATIAGGAMLSVARGLEELAGAARDMAHEVRLEREALEKLERPACPGADARALAGARDEHGRGIGTIRVIDIVPGSRDKFTRAQPVAAAWNDDRFLVPTDAEWADPLID